MAEPLTGVLVGVNDAAIVNVGLLVLDDVTVFVGLLVLDGVNVFVGLVVLDGVNVFVGDTVGVNAMTDPKFTIGRLSPVVELSIPKITLAPLPSWPARPSPKHLMSVDASNTHVCHSPIATWDGA